jgi:uncharacterized BrkB/YihY/UPF0761 family membrane protein
VSDPTSHRDVEPTLADTLRELANAPGGTGRIGQLRLRLLATAEDLTTRGTLGPIAELGWATHRRIRRVGGSALAALLAYRAFVWILPFALVCVFVVSLTDRDQLDPEVATERFGLAGFVAASISAATADAGGPGLLSGAVIGGLVLLYATFALVRAIRVVHSLLWEVSVARVSNAARTTFVALGFLAAVVFGRAFADGVADRVGGLLGVLLSLAAFVAGPAIWLLASWHLPHRARRWQELVPGAVFLFVVLAIIHSLIAHVLYPYMREREETYGGLGLAAGIMLALFGMGWAVTAAAGINAELAASRTGRESPPDDVRTLEP